VADYCSNRNRHDYVIATGEQHSIREFVDAAARVIEMSIIWTGEGLNERGSWNVERGGRRCGLSPTDGG